MFKKILLFLMCAAITLGVSITTGCTNIGNAGIKESVGEITDETGKNLNDGVIHDLPTQLLFNPQALSNETEAETAMKVTLRATITPENATNKAVDWSVSFVNASSSWASGKTVTDYVTITPTEDGSLIAEVECKEAFGEQIKIMVVSRDNPEAVAECTVDYKQKFLGYTVQKSYKFVPIDESFKLVRKIDPTVLSGYSIVTRCSVSEVYTIKLNEEEIAIPYSVKLVFSEELKTGLDNIDPKWSDIVKYQIRSTYPEKFGVTFAVMYSDGVNLGGFFDSRLKDYAFKSDEKKQAYYNVLVGLTNKESPVIFKAYDKNDNYLFEFPIGFDTSKVETLITVQDVSLDNDNLTM